MFRQTPPMQVNDQLRNIEEAVYVDVWALKAVVGIQPKPAFYLLFKALKQDEDAKITFFDPNEPAPEQRKALSVETQSQEISVWWRRGRVELPQERDFSVLLLAA